MTTITLLTEPRSFGFTALLVANLFFLTSCQQDIESVAPTPNPSPKEIYEITVTVENAPGKFTSVDGSLGFNVYETWDCLPRKTGLLSWLGSGMPTVAIARSEKLNFKQVSPNTFITKAVFDPYIPNNDYGLGVCKWSFSGVDARFHNGTSEYSIGMLEEDIQHEAVIKEAMQLDRFYMKPSPESGENWITSAGHKVTKENESEYPPDKYFYMNISTKKVMP